MNPIVDADNYIIEYLVSNNWIECANAFWYSENGKIIIQIEDIDEPEDLTVRIKATNSNGEISEWSEPIIYYYPSSSAIQPVNLIATSINDSSITIKWENVNVSDGLETAVVIDGDWYIVNQSQESYTINDLASNTLYDIYVVVSERTKNGDVEIFSDMLTIKTDSIATSIQAEMQDIYIYLNQDNTNISYFAGWIDTDNSAAKIEYRLSDGEWRSGYTSDLESGRMSFHVTSVGDSFCDFRVVDGEEVISKVLNIPSSSDYFDFTLEIPFIILDSVSDSSISISFSDMANADVVIPFIASNDHGCGTHYESITSHTFRGKQCDYITVSSGETYNIHVAYYYYLDKSKGIKYVVTTDDIDVTTE